MLFKRKQNNSQIWAMLQLSHSINNLANAMDEHTKKENEMVELVCKTLNKVSQREKEIADLIKIVNY